MLILVSLLLKLFGIILGVIFNYSFNYYFPSKSALGYILTADLLVKENTFHFYENFSLCVKHKCEEVNRFEALLIDCKLVLDLTWFALSSSTSRELGDPGNHKSPPCASKLSAWLCKVVEAGFIVVGIWFLPS